MTDYENFVTMLDRAGIAFTVHEEETYEQRVKFWGHYQRFSHPGPFTRVDLIENEATYYETSFYFDDKGQLWEVNGHPSWGRCGSLLAQEWLLFQKKRMALEKSKP